MPCIPTEIILTEHHKNSDAPSIDSSNLQNVMPAAQRLRVYSTRQKRSWPNSKRRGIDKGKKEVGNRTRTILGVSSLVEVVTVTVTVTVRRRKKRALGKMKKRKSERLEMSVTLIGVVS